MDQGEDIIKKVIKLVNNYTGERTEDLVYALQGVVAQMAFNTYSCSGEAYYAMIKAIQHVSEIKNVITKDQNETI